MAHFVKLFVLFALSLVIVKTTSRITSSNGRTGICDIYNEETGATKINCRKRRIHELSFVQSLPSSAKELDLAWNNVNQITPGTFRNLWNLTVLLLHHNQISIIHPDAFVGLENLQKLYLGFNPLSLSYDSYPVGLFRPLQNLHFLMISAFSAIKYPMKTILESPNIRTLMFTNLSPPLPPPGELTNLTKLQALDFIASNLSGLTLDFLAQVKNSNISSLSLRKCQLVNEWTRNIFIEDGALDNFPSLKTLNLACNYWLNISQVIDSLSRIPNTSIDSLVLDGVLGQPPMIFGEEDKDTCHSFWMNLRRLSLRGCNIFGYQIQINRCLPKLEVWALGFDVILAITNGSELITNIHYLDSVLPRKLKTFDFSYAFNPEKNAIKSALGCWQYNDNGLIEDEAYFPSVIDVKEAQSTSHLRKIPEKCVRYDLPIGVTSLILDHPSLRRTGDIKCVTLKSNVRKLDMSHCKGCDIRLIGPVYGLETLESADISYGKLKLVSPGSLRDLRSLISLNVSHNMLNDSGGFHLDLSTAPKLEEIDLSANGISSLNASIIPDVHPSLKYIKLSGNNFTGNNFTLNLTRLPELRLLDLTGNRLESLPMDMCRSLDKIARLRSRTVFLGLKGNSLLCQCSTIDFVQWLQSSFRIVILQLDKITCVNRNGKQQNLRSVQIDKLKRDCSKAELLQVIAVSVPICVVVVSALIGSLVYRYRWFLRWRLLKLRGYGQDEDQPVENGTAYVLHCSEDGDSDHWIHTILVNKVEREWGLKLYIPDRDDIPGKWITENIITGLESSQVAIWVLTRELLRSQTLDFITNISLLVHGPGKILLVLFDPISSMGRIPEHMKYVIKPQSKFQILEVTDDTSGESYFWSRLKAFLSDYQVPPTENQPLLPRV